MTTVFLSVHETSGDNSTAELVHELRARCAGPAAFRAVGLGGPQMAAAGVELWEETTSHALMGFYEVVTEIPRVLRNIRDTARRVAAMRPDVAVLVDAPDYNIRLAKALRALQPDLPIVYYLCPQIWAWRVGRVSQLRKYFDARFCIVPFEPAWYRARYTSAEFIGHPAVGRIQRYREQLAADASSAGARDGRAWLRQRFGLADDEPTIALLPGSRRNEIRHVLATQLRALKRLNETRAGRSLPPYRALIAVAPSRKVELIRGYLERDPVPGPPPILLHPQEGADGGAVAGTSYDACIAADIGAICSGTATVETALLGLPQVVCYRANRFSWWLLMRLVNVKFASLINLVMEREVIPELLQHNCTPERLAATLDALTAPDRLAQLRADYDEVSRRLGPGDGPARAAERISSRYFRPARVDDARSSPAGHVATAP
ncbi:MAG: lipid-A-disaccharide synthase [Planctomycetota bacterium]